MARNNVSQGVGTRQEREDIEASPRTRRRTGLPGQSEPEKGRRMFLFQQRDRQGTGGGTGRSEPDPRTHLATGGVYSPSETSMKEPEPAKRGASRKKRIGWSLGALAAGTAAGVWFFRRRGRKRSKKRDEW